MKKLLSLMLCALMALSLVGCGSSDSDGGNASNSNTYVFSSDLEVKNLDSADADDGCSFTAMNACIDGLMGLDENGLIVPAIAESHEVSDDGLVHTFKIRDNANWSNGEPVTANDFVYAWTRIFQNIGNYYYLTGSDGASIVGADEMIAKLDNEEELTEADYEKYLTEGVVAKDDKTLVVTTTTPIPYFDDFMMFPSFYPINEAFATEKGSEYGKTADAVLENGAFLLETWDVGSQITYVKNPDYYDADKVSLDGLVIKLQQQPEVAATAFENGETDYAPVSSDLVDKYKDSADYKDSLITVNDGFLFYIQINFQNEDLANYNIRKALSLAINREEFCNDRLKDGSSAATGFVPRNLSHDANGKDFRDYSDSYTAYDLTAAQEAFNQGLKELGVDQVTIELLYGNNEPPMEDLATYLQSSFSQIKGLNIEMQATTKNDRIYERQAKQNFDISCTRWGPDYSDPTTYLTLLKTGNTNNYGKYSNKELDSLLDSINKETDVTKRWNQMVEAEKIICEDYSIIPVFEKGTAVLINQKAEGILVRSFGVPYVFKYVTKN